MRPMYVPEGAGPIPYVIYLWRSWRNGWRRPAGMSRLAWWRHGDNRRSPYFYDPPER